jgi:hypothetical protein
MDTHELHFFSGSSNPTSAVPLQRFLPPLPPGVVSTWLAENVPLGSWVLDPLGASPALALEAAQAGYRVLVASNNPILSFITETLASAPSNADAQSALAGLATARRGEERLEQHIRQLYVSECDTCAEPVTVQAFLWRKGEAQPTARLYDCPNCGQSGEHPVTQADLERLKAMGGDKLQRSRALQRVILNEEEHRADVEEALANYLPRPLYVLFTLANRIEGLGLPPERARLLQALLISAFDQGNALWPWPGARSRPKQLIIPTQFRENNLWLALEDAAREWVNQSGPLPVTHWPDLPPAGQGGICLFRGRIKALMPLPKDIDLRAILTAFPRPNQAFWTLSVLWSGWLWGAEAALPLRNVLDRRRYDWNWHTSAIHNALSAVASSLPAEIPFFGLLPELVPGFLSAVITACEASGFHLEGLALRSDQEIAQGLWQTTARAASDTRTTGRPVEREAPLPRAEDLEKTVHEALRADLLARNEPAPYLTEYTAGMASLAMSGSLPRNTSNIPGDLLSRVQAILARTFSDRAAFKVYGGSSEEERGAWWLARDPVYIENNAELPLADRVEMEIVRFMQKQADFTFEELEQRVCAQFPGLLTPTIELVRACLESYGEVIPPSPGSKTGVDVVSSAQFQHWRMRSSELAAARKADLQQIRTTLGEVGRRFGFTINEHGSTLAWERQGAVVWWFGLMASSIFSRYILAASPEAIGGRVLVLPGSRARLVSFKLRRDPRLQEAMSGSQTPWRFLKFRHLREMAEQADITAANWAALLDEDPLTGDAVQMQLFGD